MAFELHDEVCIRSPHRRVSLKSKLLHYRVKNREMASYCDIVNHLSSGQNPKTHYLGRNGRLLNSWNERTFRPWNLPLSLGWKHSGVHTISRNKFEGSLVESPVHTITHSMCHNWSGRQSACSRSLRFMPRYWENWKKHSAQRKRQMHIQTNRESETGVNQITTEGRLTV